MKLLHNVFAATLLSGVLASPSSQNKMSRRNLDFDNDCIEEDYGAPPGKFFAVGSDGYNLSCDDARGASSDNGVDCYMTNGDEDSLGSPVKCPGDPQPSKNPDGSDAQVIADGFISTYCSIANPDPLVAQMASFVGCLMYGYYEAHGSPVAEAQMEAVGLCDIVFAGGCTYFINMAPEIAAGAQIPCTDDPGYNLCSVGMD